MVAPALAGLTPAGTPLAIPTGAGARLVVAFLTSSCRTCAVFWEALRAEGGHSPHQGPTMAIVTPDATTENRREVQRLAPAGWPVVMSSEAWTAWDVWGSPFFVVVADGVIVAEGVAASWTELLDLIPVA